MKKILFGSAAAICAAVGLSSFQTTKFTGPIYFKVIASQKSPGSSFAPADVQHILSSSVSGCSSSNTYDCVVTFLTSNLTQINLTKLAVTTVARATVSFRSN